MTDEELFIMETTAARELIDECERVVGDEITDDALVIVEQAAHMAIHAPFEWSVNGDLYFYGKKFEVLFV
ncbi:hypothetical protein [uncultured Alteromonas sp.]|uniref:hypothetical protein n=1 Tax=uncultured Alteromonas sp. TaxID=179113 RepID=UPI0030ECFBEA